ncbi:MULTISPECIES: winged helix-turn-helix domain-containing protein [unclassified Serratia (in: enterobacteria)]|uniref:winged helix-turn-helix domain-containing protein n=1 Tax=unclassified Serratia (in: enterobacteria) TaxID=2647522 RepID=UPI0004687EAD|nr:MULTISPECIES: winged helix-turn-helix domain-containing protein [unclassified Serratia (in: enterobacteria)]
MKYIIDTGLVFDSDERTLFLQESPGESLEIGAITARLFVEMLENVSGVERDYLLDVVWSNHGLKPSNNNLNNHISLLRKNIASIAAVDDLIITLPKKGFVVNKKYSVNVVGDAVAEPPVEETKAAKNATAMDYPVTLWVLSITIVILLLLLGLVITKDYHALFGLC